jgi:hypothetical protein
MKTTNLMMAILLWSVIGVAQPIPTMRIEKLKDAWDVPVTYVGEVKNGKPNGLGMFIYQGDNALRYAGNFVDGLPQGKGTLIFNNGAFLTGEWVKGKLDGKGANHQSDGNLYIGQFADGKKSGKGTFFFNDNGFSHGSFANDVMEGRAIYISEEGKILNDNYYKNDIKNGPGYQYEIDQKKLFKGIWADGKWVKASDPPYTSFVTDKRFTAENTDKQTLMGIVNSDGKVHDTAYFRDKINKKRFFGVYNNGKLADGFTIREDFTIFMGKLNTAGANGYASFLKRGKFYHEGIFADDFLNGANSLSIDLEKKNIYYGSAINKGEFTGKAWFVNNKSTLFNGEYEKGKFTGNGWRLDSAGYRITGLWQGGALQKLTLLTGPNGKPVNMTPATLAEAITQLLIFYGTEFAPIAGSENFDELLMDADFVTESYYKPLPTAKLNYIMDFDGGYAHLSVVFDGDDEKVAAAKYEALCKQLAAINLPLTKSTTPHKLTTQDDMKPKDTERSITIFTIIPASLKGWGMASVMVVLLNDPATYTYKVMLAVGDDYAVEGWLDYY